MKDQEAAGRTVVRRLRDHGFQGLFAGGCVRDRLLGRAANDVDVATDAEPADVQQTFRKTIGVGAQFGIVVVRCRGESIEVATFRADGEYQDGRRPESVRFTTAEEDAQRRDFTINGLFYDPIDEVVLDYVQGREDLRLGVVRAIRDPHERFAEDKLRVLRAPRFAAALGFRIEAETARAARRFAPDVEAVSAERIHVELTKILKAPTRSRGLCLAREVGVLEVVLPELGDARAAERALAALPPHVDVTTAWAAAFADLLPPRADAALARLKATNKERARVGALLQALPIARTFAARGVAEQKEWLARDEWWDGSVADLLRAVALAGDGDLEPTRYLHTKHAAYAADPSPAHPLAPPLLKGADLKAAGFPPGPRFGPLLAAARAAQRAGHVRTTQEALDWIR